jgi:hypothetical protein
MPPLGLAGAAVAADAPALPPAVVAGVKAAAAICTEVGGRPRTADAVKRADLTGDGKEDFVLAVDSIECEGAYSIYGDREKSFTVYTGDGKGGASEVYSGAAYGLRIEGGKLWLTLSGGDCGKPPAPDFASENFCDRPLAWNAATKKFGYAPLNTVRMIQ